MALMMPVNAADLTADAYGRRKPKYPVIPETLGLALVLLISRNTARERGVWLAAPEISDALCLPPRHSPRTRAAEAAARLARGSAGQPAVAHTRHVARGNRAVACPGQRRHPVPDRPVLGRRR